LPGPDAIVIFRALRWPRRDRRCGGDSYLFVQTDEHRRLPGLESVRRYTHARIRPEYVQGSDSRPKLNEFYQYFV
jgi:hypothetical protein